MTEPRLKEVIAVVNAKGGVGKTTTVQNIAAGMIRWNMNLRVLVIDLDAQCNASYLMGWNRDEREGQPTVYDALRTGGSLPVYQATTEDGKPRRGVFYSPASKYLEIVSSDLYKFMNSKMVLAQCFGRGVTNFTDIEGLENILYDFDYVLIDCPPAMSEVTYNALGVASQLIIPMQLEGMAVQGLADLMTVYKTVHEQLNHNLELMGILKVMTQDRLNTSKGYSEMLAGQFEDKVFNARIRRSNKINEAQTLRKDIFEYAPKSPVAEDYSDLVREIMTR